MRLRRLAVNLTALGQRAATMGINVSTMAPNVARTLPRERCNVPSGADRRGGDDATYLRYLRIRIL